MPSKKNIILVGFMGAGKDTVGRDISSLTGLKFISTDDYIALKEGCPVKQLIETRGLEYFRAAEHRALLSLKLLNNIVLATGGGIVLDPRNRKILRAMGTVIHLGVSAENAARRLKDDHCRPLARDRNSILSIHRERQGMYDFADHQIDTNHLSAVEASQRIARTLRLKAPPANGLKTRIFVRAPSRAYPVFIGPLGDRAHVSVLKTTAGPARRAVIVTNPLVGAIFISEIRNLLRETSVETDVMTIPDGENHKSVRTALEIIDFFMDRRLTRSDLAVALGGGVIGDITGLAASLFKRGIALIQVPTTLLAQVDAAVGGKTGANHRLGKNMIGAFYQPRAVFCDPASLATLPDADYLNGIAEVIKYGIIADGGLFRMMEKNPDAVKMRDRTVLHHVIKRCLAIKKAVVESDEREEKGLREILNFGHTMGHALETLTGHAAYQHGRAVSVGMALESRAALDSGILNERDYRRIIELLETYDLPTAAPSAFTKKDFLGALVHDKKMNNGRIRLPVPVCIGKTVFKEVTCKKLL